MANGSQGYKETESLAIYDAPAFFMDSFVDYLEANGMKDSQKDEAPYRVSVGGRILETTSNHSLTGLVVNQWVQHCGRISAELVFYQYDFRSYDGVGVYRAIESLNSEMIAWLNKESDNFYAEMLLKTLSA